jgi:hypothetical protein
MRCEKVQRVLNRLVDSELDRWSAWRVRRHLTDCRECASEYRQIEALGMAMRSWRNVTPSSALQARLVTIAGASERTRRTPRAAGSAPFARVGDKLGIQTRRWGVAVTAAVLLAVFWSQTQRSTPVLAAVIRATEAAPAVHMVGIGSRGSRIELWWVDHLGSSMRAKRENDEQLDVDNLKQRFMYQVRERRMPIPPQQLGDGDKATEQHTRTVIERRVEMDVSALADPRWAAWQRDSLSSTGLLKQMARRHAPREISNTLVVRDGRRLRRLTARGEPRIFYADPNTNRVVLLEDWGGTPGPLSEFMRIEIDYPDPARVDRKLFEFQVPPGVTVHRVRSRPSDQRQVLSKQEKVWLAQQNALNQCLSQLGQIREALRRYANEHGGEWPAVLTPALDPYLKDRTVFHCPLDRAAAETRISYTYHRPVGPRAATALLEMNDRFDQTLEHSSRQPVVLLDCGYHPRLIWHIDSQGETTGTYRPGAR